ncbi:unnamed protein product [Laminaria digitata]
MDGTDYTQSIALLRYAGKLAGLYPEDLLAALKVDEIVLMAEDVFINIFFTVQEKDEAKKLELCKVLIAGKIKNLLEDIARKVSSNTSSAFSVGDSLSIADLQIHAVIATVEAGFLTGIPPTMVEDIAPSLKALDNAIMEHPKVKAYYASQA